MYYTFDRAGNMMPVARIEKRADEPWQVFSGRENSAACLDALEAAHECCLTVSMLQAAEAAIKKLAARGMKTEEGRA